LTALWRLFRFFKIAGKTYIFFLWGFFIMGNGLIAGRPNVTKGYVDVGLYKATTHTYEAASQAEMLALNANIGDVALRTDVNETYLLAIDDPTDIDSWEKILVPGGLTLNTFTAAVTTTWTGTDSTGYSQDVVVTGLLATDTPIIDIVFSSTLATAKLEAEAYACVSKATTADDTLSLLCFDFKPVTAFNLQLKCFR
jgi:hypothetical protein